MNPVLVVTAVPVEREAVRAGLPDDAGVVVATVGVGPAAAAAGTARLLALAEAEGRPYRAVVSAGVAGGFPDRAEIGTVVVATASVHADLGADSPDGFIPLGELGFGSHRAAVDPDLTATLRRRLPEAVAGEVLTVATVTGTAARAVWLAKAHPQAVAEAMEGYGVACAAATAGTPFAELRTVSNMVGPRDRAAWRLDEALRALTAAAPALAALATGTR